MKSIMTLKEIYEHLAEGLYEKDVLACTIYVNGQYQDLVHLEKIMNTPHEEQMIFERVDKKYGTEYGVEIIEAVSGKSKSIICAREVKQGGRT